MDPANQSHRIPRWRYFPQDLDSGGQSATRGRGGKIRKESEKERIENKMK